MNSPPDIYISKLQKTSVAILSILSCIFFSRKPRSSNFLSFLSLQFDAKLPAYAREGDIEYPFEDTHGTGDENRIRGFLYLFFEGFSRLDFQETGPARLNTSWLRLALLLE